MALGGDHYDGVAIGSLVSMAPQIASESSASIRGLSHIAKNFGFRRALREAPALAVALSSYLTMPAVVGSGMYLDNKRKKLDGSSVQ